MRVNKIKKLLLLMMVVAGLFAGQVLAQEAPAAPASEVETVYKKTTIIDFSDVTITGELTKPEGSYLMNKKKAVKKNPSVPMKSPASTMVGLYMVQLEVR